MQSPASLVVRGFVMHLLPARHAACRPLVSVRGPKLLPARRLCNRVDNGALAPRNCGRRMVQCASCKSRATHDPTMSLRAS